MIMLGFRGARAALRASSAEGVDAGEDGLALGQVEARGADVQGHEELAWGMICVFERLER